MLVQVENGRATRLRGDPDHPVTRGFLCGKVAQYLDREYSPERLLYPQKRVGAKGENRFERISWDEALDIIAGRLTAVSRDFGPEAILPYSYAYAREVYDDHVIVDKGDNKQCKVSYKLNDDGSVTLGKDETPVEQKWVDAGKIGRAHV